MMKKEIGSEFCEPLTSGNGGFNPDVDRYKCRQFVDSGRSAIELAIKDILTYKPAVSVYMPSYFCDSMIIPFKRNGIEVCFYDVTADRNGINFGFDFSNEHEIIFLMNYFGFENSALRNIAAHEKARGKTVIYDATQAIFAPFPEADYVVISLRKWFYSTAAMLLKNEKLNSAFACKCTPDYLYLKKTAAEQKYRYIYGDSGNKEEYLRLFSEYEELLDTQSCVFAAEDSEVSRLLASDYEHIRRIRRENAEFLLKELSSVSAFDITLPFGKLGDTDVPMAVPILLPTEQRDYIRSRCRENNIYLPIHWPLPESCRLNEKQLFPYEHELSIVCDQRYNVSDMQHIVDVIKG